MDRKNLQRPQWDFNRLIKIAGLGSTSKRMPQGVLKREKHVRGEVYAALPSKPTSHVDAELLKFGWLLELLKEATLLFQIGQFL